MEERLRETGLRYFEAHPDRTIVPYVTYLMRNEMTGRLDLIPKVGQGPIDTFRHLAIAEVITGEIGIDLRDPPRE